MSRAINLRQYVTDPLERIRRAEGLEIEADQQPPDEPLDHELRYLGIWRAWLGVADDS